MLLRCLLLWSAAAFLHASLEDHFKKIPEKTDGHSMRNIDFIYMINLDQRPEKFARSSLILSLYGVEPFRFSAVNGWELSLETINDVGVCFEPWMSVDQLGTFYTSDEQGVPVSDHGRLVDPGRTYFCHCMSRGSIGIALSHLSILQDAYDSGYQTIWVMEDDIEVIRNVDELPELIDRLDAEVGADGWDILFTDQDTKNNKGDYVPCASHAWRPNFVPNHAGRFVERRDVSSEFRQIGSRYGAYSMIVRRSGMKKILDFMKNYQIFLPFDMEFTQPNDIHLFSVKSDVVSTCPNAFSDNGAPNYMDKND